MKQENRWLNCDYIPTSAVSDVEEVQKMEHRFQGRTNADIYIKLCIIMKMRARFHFIWLWLLIIIEAHSEVTSKFFRIEIKLENQVKAHSN